MDAEEEKRELEIIEQNKREHSKKVLKGLAIGGISAVLLVVLFWGMMIIGTIWFIFHMPDFLVG